MARRRRCRSGHRTGDGAMSEADFEDEIEILEEDFIEGAWVVPEARRALVCDYITFNLIHAYNKQPAIPVRLVTVQEPDDLTTIVLVGGHPVFIAWDVYGDESEPSAGCRLIQGPPSPELAQVLGLPHEDGG